MNMRLTDLLSPAQYLAAEQQSSLKREYLAGAVYALPEAGNRHNRIATNVLVILSNLLRGRVFEVFNCDTKIRIQLSTHSRFYYPDASVICPLNPDTDTFQDRPVVVIEVVSRQSRRTDEVEKREGYLSIPSLRAYLLLEQETPTIVAFTRGDQGFERRVYEGLSSTIPLEDLEIDLPLAEVYERVTFEPE